MAEDLNLDDESGLEEMDDGGPSLPEDPTFPEYELMEDENAGKGEPLLPPEEMPEEETEEAPEAEELDEEEEEKEPEAPKTPKKRNRRAGLKKRVNILSDKLREVEERALAAEARAADMERNQAAAMENSTTGELKQVERFQESLRAQLKDAIEGGDTAAQVKIQEAMADTIVRRRELGHRSQQAKQQVQQQQAVPPPMARAAASWSDRNAHWIKDPKFAHIGRRAQELELKMARDRGWQSFDMADDLFYDELTAELAKTAPPGMLVDSTYTEVYPSEEQTAKPRASRPAPVVAPPSPRQTTARKAVGLTADDRRRMEAFGMDPTSKRAQVEWMARKQGTMR